MFYAHTVSEIKRALAKKYPYAKPESLTCDSPHENHVLWIVEEIEGMRTDSQVNSARAAWLIGRALTLIDTDLLLWSYDHSRTLLNIDAKNRADLPHRTSRLHSV